MTKAAALKAIGKGLGPLGVASAIVKAPARLERIRTGKRGFFRRGWLGLRDVVLRPVLGL